jgi:6-phosphofructo-2-kinase / fructose-2,6-biphosphatase 2
MAYAEALPGLVRDSIGDRNVTLWTSTMKRTIQTAQFLKYPKKQWKALDELDAGVCDGLTYEEIEKRYPDDFRARDDDKWGSNCLAIQTLANQECRYNYRYQGGESYRDVVIRLEPIIMEMERGSDIMVVTHQAILRCIYAYFMNVPQDQSPWMEIPLHTVIKLTPRAYGTQEERYVLLLYVFAVNDGWDDMRNRFKANIPAVSTFRAKYTSANMGGEAAIVDGDRVKSPVDGAQANGIITIKDDVEAAPTKPPSVVVESLGLNGNALKE